MPGRTFLTPQIFPQIQDGTLSTSSDPALPWALLPWEFYGDMILASNFTDNFSYMEKVIELIKKYILSITIVSLNKVRHFKAF